jgi:phage terminase large subunit
MEWIAQPGPQTFALSVPDDINEIFYGGARGGGKTDTGIVWMGEKVDEPLFRGLVIRKNANDLQDWVDRASRMYSGQGVHIAYRPWELSFPSGAKIITGHLKDEQSYTKYQGQEYQRQLLEEITQIRDEKRYLQLKASNRSTVPGLKAQTFLTGNPGGIGHSWVKNRFIDIAPHYSVYKDPHGLRRIYIPATIEDNPMLSQNDPDYVRQMDALKDTDPDLWKAWRMGDWSIIAGQAFREWNPNMHVNDTFEFKLSECKKFIGFDWGYSAPGCALWCAITPENKYGIVRIYVYRELYLTQTEPREWARQFKMLQKLDGVRDLWLPHDCFNKEMGESIADIFSREGTMNVLQAKTLQGGARHMRKALLHSVLADADDGRPILQVHSNARNLTRTIPELINDDNDPEDIDTDGEDHAYDALTEALMMVVPHFARSGPVKFGEQIREIKTQPFSVLPEGSILPPDLMEAVAKQHSRPPSRPRPT